VDTAGFIGNIMLANTVTVYHRNVPTELTVVTRVTGYTCNWLQYTGGHSIFLNIVIVHVCNKNIFRLIFII